MVRRLNDGREYRIVKHFHAADELRDRAAAVGLDIEMATTPAYFQYARGPRV